MAMNFDSSLDEIEKIIPSPKINKNTKDLFSEEEESKSNLDLKNNNLDSFGKISQINNEEEENSLNMNNNNKNSKLPSTNENTENSKKTKNRQSSEEIVKNSNELNYFNFKNIQSNRINNNEKKYRILFDKNKKLNIHSLREEYNKIKKNINDINVEYKPNYNKRYISIFNDNKQKINHNNCLLNLSNNKRRTNRNIILHTNNNFDDVNLKLNFITKNNSKQKETNDKINNFKNQLIKESIILNKKNNKIWESKNKNIKNLNNINVNYSKLNLNNISKKTREKKYYIYEEYKANSSNNNLKFSNTKSTKVEYSNINKKNPKMNLFNRYNKLCSDLLNDEKNNSKINSILSFNKITESNKIENLDNDFDTVYNKVESKIRQNKIEIMINEESKKYYNKIKYNKIIPKLLSISQNEPMNNCLIKNSNRNNLFSNNFKLLYRNNLNTQINLKIMKPFRKENNHRWNNYIISDFSINQNN